MTYLPLRTHAKNIIKRNLSKKNFELVRTIWRNTGVKLIKHPAILNNYQKQFIEANGLKVTGGPFKEMSYVNQSMGSVYLTKLIGSYEEILHPYIERYKKMDYTTIIDIGCAEGYYLIGLGLYNKKAKLVGYDIEEQALTLTKNLFEKNNLNNELILEKECTFDKLNTQITENTLIICDCEGFEGIILDPEKVKSLKNVQSLVVELHDFAYPNIKNILTDRFSSTHTISVVTFKHASIEKYPFLKEMKNEKDRYYILYERVIQDQEWLVMEKK